MTPETRAARDRIAAFLTERSGALTDTIACSGASRDATRLTASDLAAVLAALDDEPEGSIAFPADMATADIQRFCAAWDAAQGPERALTLTLDNRTATFKAKPWPAEWADGRKPHPATPWREPCNVALSNTIGHIRCQLAVSDPLPEGYLESGGRYTGNRNHWEKHWHEDEHGQVRTWTDSESEGA